MGTKLLLLATLGLYGCGLPVVEDSGPTRSPTAVIPRAAEAKLEGKVLLSNDKGLWVWNGGSARQLTKEGSLQQPAWSPDGKKIAYVRLEGDYSDIWVMGTSGDSPVNLTRFGRSGADTWAFSPRWSPDGTQLAYVSDQNTYDLALWTMKSDGAGRKQITLMNDYLGGIDGPTWHPKGDRLTFTAYRTGKAQVWTMTLANSRWQQATDVAGGAYDPQWSPSGDALAFAAWEGGKSDVWAVPQPDGVPERVSRDGLSRSPAWSPDGKMLAFLSGQGGRFDLWTATLEKTPEGAFRFGAPKRVTQGLGADPAGGLSWTR